MESHVGIALPQIPLDGPISSEQLRRFCAHAEGAGYDGVWVGEFRGPSGSLEPIGTLAFAAAVTQRVRLGVAVLVLPRHVPARLASLLAGVDRLSDGRLVVGVGVGRDGGLDPAYGMVPGDRGTRMEEGLTVLKALWRGEPVTFQGTHWTLDGLEVSPTPVSQPFPPLLFGGRHPGALERAVRLGDGWIGAGSSSLEAFASEAKLVEEELERQHRRRDHFRVGRRVYLVVDRHGRRFHEDVRRWFGSVYGRPELADDVVLNGTPEECLEGLQGIREAGADTLILHPVVSRDDMLDLLAAEILPAVRGAAPRGPWDLA